MDTLSAFKTKVAKVAKKCWPKELPMNGNLRWLYHNHNAYSGNVPMWADWVWPKGKDMDKFQIHFLCLLIGQHPAGGSEACCSRVLCKDRRGGSVYNHHYFECVDFIKNRRFFRDGVKRLYSESVASGYCDIPAGVINGILGRPCRMWFGLIDPCLFDLGLKLGSIHELHRIVTMASVLSWGRFYLVP